LVYLLFIDKIILTQVILFAILMIEYGIKFKRKVVVK
jgi:hypothetical protein